jgi:hypothetical protein
MQLKMSIAAGLCTVAPAPGDLIYRGATIVTRMLSGD